MYNNQISNSLTTAIIIICDLTIINLIYIFSKTFDALKCRKVVETIIKIIFLFFLN